jgi:hypothetical protein
MLPARVERTQKKRKAPIALHDRAMDNLRFIRETMERSTSFTAVSGVAGVIMGSVAVVAAFVAWSMRDRPQAWLFTWLVAAVLAGAAAFWAMARKAEASGMSLLTGPGRKFALFFSPPIFVGALLTAALVRMELIGLLPGVWLLLYGTAVVSGGAFSVRIVPMMGIGFMLVGALALFAPSGWGDAFMAVGFGVLHIVFGFVIWRKHGG